MTATWPQSANRSKFCRNEILNPSGRRNLAGIQTFSGSTSLVSRPQDDSDGQTVTEYQLGAAGGGSVSIGFKEAFVEQNDLVIATIKVMPISGSGSLGLTLNWNGFSVQNQLAPDGGDIVDDSFLGNWTLAPNASLPAGQWTELTGFGLASVGHVKTGFLAVTVGASGKMVFRHKEAGFFRNPPFGWPEYADGDTPGWEWLGPDHGSPSFGPAIRASRRPTHRGYSIGSLLPDNFPSFITSVQQIVDLLVRCGCTAVRTTIDLRQPGFNSNPINWTTAPLVAYDAFYNACQAAGIGVVANLLGTPGGAQPNTPPSNVAAWASVAAQIATRWPGLAGIEVWNEQNLNVFWIAPSATAYVALLVAAYQAIKTAVPSMKVISGGLSTATGATLPDINTSTYLTAMYAAGADDYYDALGLHAYLSEQTNGSASGGAGAYGSVISNVRTQRYLNADSKPVFVTEMGISTGSPVPGGSFASGETAQAGLIAAQYGMLARDSLLGVDGVFIHEFAPPDYETAASWAGGYAAIHPDPNDSTQPRIRRLGRIMQDYFTS